MTATADKSSTTKTDEATIASRVEDRPTAQPAKIKRVRKRDIGYRFLAGAVTSIASGIVALWLGARVGGILLAFPAILAASLTLIEEQEDGAHAREDARGAVIRTRSLRRYGRDHVRPHERRGCPVGGERRMVRGGRSGLSTRLIQMNSRPSSRFDEPPGSHRGSTH